MVGGVAAVPPDASGTVDYTTVDGTALAGTDYVAATGRLAFLPGNAFPRPVSITVFDDAIDEPNEQFMLVLSNPQGGVVLGDATAVVTIVDNDPVPRSRSATASLEGDAGSARMLLRRRRSSPAAAASP